MIGTLMEEYQGRVDEKMKIRLTFELPTETKVFKEENGPQPRVISEEYTLSLGEKSNLRPIVEGIVGKLSEEAAKAFDIESLVGKSCLLNITHKPSKKGVMYEHIASTSPLIKGMEKPAQVNPSRIQTFQNWDQAYFDNLPQFIKDKIISSHEYQHMVGGGESKVEEEENDTVTIHGLTYPKDTLSEDPFADF
jgi:hypothetical protein